MHIGFLSDSYCIPMQSLFEFISDLNGIPVALYKSCWALVGLCNCSVNSILWFLWDCYCIPIEIVLNSYWVPHEVLLKSNWIPVEFLLNAHRIPIGFLLYPYELPVEIILNSYWIPMELLLGSF